MSSNVDKPFCHNALMLQSSDFKEYVSIFCLLELLSQIKELLRQVCDLAWADVDCWFKTIKGTKEGNTMTF